MYSVYNNAKYSNIYYNETHQQVKVINVNKIEMLVHILSQWTPGHHISQ